MKRIISLILVLVMILPMAVSCNNEKGDETGGTVSTDNEMFNYLPDKNYGGADFIIHARLSDNREFGTIDDISEIVNQSLVMRNDVVNTDFGVNIKTIAEDFNWSTRDDYISRLETSISAGEKAFDLISGYTAIVTKLVSRGLFLNWNEFDYVDCSNDWWVEQFNNEMTINGKCYMIVGDSSLTMWENMACVFFNKKFAEEYNVEDLYAAVRGGTWDYEMLKTYTKRVYVDKDNDQTHSNGDLYGMLLGRSTPIDHFMQAFNLPVTKKNTDGMPEIALMSEKFIMVAQDMVEFVNTESNNVWLVAEENAGGELDSMREMYMRNQGLFYLGLLKDSELIRTMDDESGILPYPKYNGNQKKYYSTSRDEFSSLFCPLDARDTEKTAIITEALCVASNKLVIPKYYEVVLKTKSSSDYQSGEMIDIIRDGISFNYGFLYGTSIGHIHHFLGAAVCDNASYVSGTYKSKESSYKAELAKILAYYQE